jgi:hypothetical protein
LTLEPAAPASARKTHSAANPGANAAAVKPSPQSPIPVAIAARSPIRSASSPHGSSVNVAPTHAAERTTPTCVSDRSNSSRSAGASAGSPTPTMENPTCAHVPAARTAQR